MVFSNIKKLRDSLLQVDNVIINYYKSSLTKLLNLDDNKPLDMLYKLYCWSTINASGAGGGLNKSCAGAENLKKYFSQFKNIDDIRDVEKWNFSGDIQKGFKFSDKIKYLLNNNLINSYDGLYDLQKIVFKLSADTGFSGMKEKTASLFIYILHHVFKFFNKKNIDKDVLFIPVDNINTRMLGYFWLPENFDENKYESIFKILLKKDKRAHILFYLIAKDIMVDDEKACLLENFWYIGHFYHENMRNPISGGKTSLKKTERVLNNNEMNYSQCYLREALAVSEHFGFSNLDQNESCPFFNNNCKYKYKHYNKVLKFIYRIK